MQRSVGNARLSRMLNLAAGHGAVTQDAPVGGSGDGDFQMLSVSQPDSPSEREAEAVAQRVTAGHIAPPITPVSSGEIHSIVHSQEEKNEETAPTSAAQHQENEEEHPPLAQREATGPATESMDTSAATNVVAHKGAGSPVNPDLRRELEPRMGADLGAARVHNDSDANEAASSINARAFTHGSDIFLARGESERDTHLMAHELTHVVQQTSAGATGEAPQASLVHRKENTAPQPAAAKASKGASAKPAEKHIAPGVLELKDMTGKFDPPSPIKEFIEGRKGKEAIVNARFGSLAGGELIVRKRGRYYDVNMQRLTLTHPLFARAAQANLDLKPSLVVYVDGKQQLQGYVGLGGKSTPSREALKASIDKAPDAIGLAGFDLKEIKLTNAIEDGQLRLGLDAGVKIDAAFSGKVSLRVVDGEVSEFKGSVAIIVGKLAKGDLNLERNKLGQVAGRASLAVQFGDNLSGDVVVEWLDGRIITGEGKIKVAGEKLSGLVTVKLTEKNLAAQLEKEKNPPPEAAGKAPVAPAAAKPKEGKPPPSNITYVLFGEGDLNYKFNDWLNGTAHVIVDPGGDITIIGKITPQKEFQLFGGKHFPGPHVGFEAEASYGLPVVGSIGIFGGLALDAYADIFPAKLYDIVIDGEYSTDPKKNKAFGVSAKINISAEAGISLTAKVGLVLTILKHKIKPGAEITGTLGIKGYLESEVNIGYREKGAPGEDKKGEFYIGGDIEIAAQPFFRLKGDLFIELDSPWWSPAPDKTWTWPLGSKEWPLGGGFGINASVNHILGSGEWPQIDFEKVSFDEDKFLNGLYNDEAQSDSGEPSKQPGKWKERTQKHQQQAEPPQAVSAPAKTAPARGKSGAPPTGRPKRAAAKDTGDTLDPNAVTADGHKVKDLMEKGPPGGRKGQVKDPKGSTTATESKAEPDPAKKAQSEELPKGRAALDAVVARYKKDGATRKEMETALGSVRRKFPVFKSIKAIDDGGMWDIKYVYNPEETMSDVIPVVAEDTGKLLEGRADATAANIERAKEQMAKITSASQVSATLEKVGRFEVYKAEYLEVYLKKLEKPTFEWPLTYLKNRASRKLGKKDQKYWAEKVYGAGAHGKAFKVKQPDGTEKVRVPDVFIADKVVADVKDVEYQDYDKQMQDDYKIAHAVEYPGVVTEVAGDKPFRGSHSFEVIVRSKDHTQGKTDVSGPLDGAADKIHYVITDQEDTSTP